jgi:hypothetical protein
VGGVDGGAALMACRRYVAVMAVVARGEVAATCILVAWRLLRQRDAHSFGVVACRLASCRRRQQQQQQH